MPFMTLMISGFGAPTGLMATGGNGTISLTANSVPTAISYDVRRSPSGAATWTDFALLLGTPAYTDSACDVTASGFTGYWDYEMNCQDGLGDTSPWSAIATASPYIVCDLCSGTNGTSVDARTPDAVAVGTNKWSALAGTWQTDGSSHFKNTTGGSVDKLLYDAGNATVTVQVKFATDGVNNTGILTRTADDNNRILFSRAGNLFVKVSGTENNRGSASFTAASGDTYKISWSGNTITCYHNGTSVITYTLTAGEATALAGNTKHGLLCNSDTTGRFTNFAVNT